jgi:uncharacterized protein (DUF2147 family)
VLQMTRLMRIVMCGLFSVRLLIVDGAGHAAAGTPDPTGTWLTEDGRARIRIEYCGPSLQQVCGYVVWMKTATDAQGQPARDASNPDPAKRVRLLLGHQLILGLKPAPDGRFAGQIYDAESGKLHAISLWRATPDRLSIRGCMLGLLCAMQTWKQTTDVMPGQLVGMTGDPNGPRADREWAHVSEIGKRAAR